MKMTMWVRFREAHLLQKTEWPPRPYEVSSGKNAWGRPSGYHAHTKAEGAARVGLGFSRFNCCFSFFQGGGGGGGGLQEKEEPLTPFLRQKESSTKGGVLLLVSRASQSGKALPASSPIAERHRSPFFFQ